MSNSQSAPNELDHRIRKLIYRANHRGIKEMDIILGRFAKANLSSFDARELDQFEEILQENDRDLLPWFIGEVDYPSEKPREMFERIMSSLDQGAAL